MSPAYSRSIDFADLHRTFSVRRWMTPGCRAFSSDAIPVAVRGGTPEEVRAAAEAQVGRCIGHARSRVWQGGGGVLASVVAGVLLVRRFCRPAERPSPAA